MISLITLFILVMTLMTNVITNYIIPFQLLYFIFIILVIIFVFNFQIFSPFTFCYVTIFYPTIAKPVCDLFGFDFINYHNHFLQSDIQTWNISINFVLLCLSSSLLLLLNFKKIRFYRIQLRSSSNKYIILFSSLALLFFWLTDPSFKTILTFKYQVVMDDRFSGTNFAGPLGFIFWLTATVIFKFGARQCSRIQCNFYYFSTFISLMWLLLHSRRSELIGMLIILLFVYNNKKIQFKYVIPTLSFFVIAVLIGYFRDYSLVQFLLNEKSSIDTNIFSLPGGGSNIFSTLIISIDYFKSNDYLLGYSFICYLLQILPTTITEILNLQPPPFYSDIYYKYSYNGGSYILSLFYGNFGILGFIPFSIFFFIFNYIIVKCLKSHNTFIIIIGLFLLGFCLKSFWYGLIILIKPFILLVSFYLLISIFNNDDKARVY